MFQASRVLPPAGAASQVTLRPLLGGVPLPHVLPGCWHLPSLCHKSPSRQLRRLVHMSYVLCPQLWKAASCAKCAAWQDRAHCAI